MSAPARTTRYLPSRLLSLSRDVSRRNGFQTYVKLIAGRDNYLAKPGLILVGVIKPKSLQRHQNLCASNHLAQRHGSFIDDLILGLIEVLFPLERPVSDDRKSVARALKRRLVTNLQYSQRPMAAETSPIFGI